MIVPWLVVDRWPLFALLWAPPVALVCVVVAIVLEVCSVERNERKRSSHDCDGL